MIRTRLRSITDQGHDELMDDHDLPWEPGLASVWDQMSASEREAFLDVEGEEPPSEVGDAVRRTYEAHRRKM